MSNKTEGEKAVKSNHSSGNGKPGKISLYDKTWFPKISHLVSGLTDTEMRAIEVMVSKEPSDTWDKVAKRIGITARQLFNIRQNEDVQQACYLITKTLFKSDIPDVLKKLTERAKAGEAWAVKLFLEVAGEYVPRGEHKITEERNFTDPSELAEKTLRRLDELYNNKSVDRLRGETTKGWG